MQPPLGWTCSFLKKSKSKRDKENGLKERVHGVWSKPFEDAVYIEMPDTLSPPHPLDYVSPQAYQDFVKNRADILWFEQEEDVFPSSKVDEMLSA